MPETKKVAEMMQAVVEMLAEKLIHLLMVGEMTLVVEQMLTHLQVAMTLVEMLVAQMLTHLLVGEMMQGVVMQAETQTHLQVEGTMQVVEQTMLERMQELTMQEPLKESLLLTMP